MSFKLIPFALQVASGRYIDPSEADRGAECGCICPSCKTPLIARQGGSNANHFAHRSRNVYKKTNKACEFSPMVAVRMMARQQLEDELEITLPDYYRYFGSDKFLVTKSSRVYLKDVKVERMIGKVPVDCSGHIGPYELIIYFTHKGRHPPLELQEIKSEALGIISVDIEPLGILFLGSKKLGKPYKQILTEFLSNDLESKCWLYHPRQKKIVQQQKKRLTYSGTTSTDENDSVFRLIPLAPEEGAKEKFRFGCIDCSKQWSERHPEPEKCPYCSSPIFISIRDNT